MDRIIQLRKSLTELLKAANPRVYFMDAPKDAAFPYLVYDLPNSVDDGTLENFVLEVDGWSQGADTMAVEQLMEAADAALHRQVIRAEDLAIILYRDNRLTIPDDEKQIHHRRYVYQARTYGGG
jgi:hypothetical protein